MAPGFAVFARLLGGALALPLVWLALVWVVWIPGSRQLSVGLRAEHPTTLIVFCDVGRGFYPGDSIRYPIGALEKRWELALPIRARSIRVELADPAAAITGVALGDRQIYGLKESPSTEKNVVTIGSVPKVKRPPVWLGVGCGIVAFAMLSGALSWRAAARIAKIGGMLARPPALTSFGFGAAWLLFMLLLAILRVSATAYDVLYGPIDFPPHWPISIYDPRPLSPGVVGAGCLLLAVAYAATRGRLQTRHRTFWLAGAVCVAFVAGNLLYGWHGGVVEPTSGSRMYLADARSIASASGFLSTFVERQSQLRIHGRTHPPGAELLFYVLAKLFRSPGTIGIVLGVGSILATSLCLYAILRARVGRQRAIFGACCFASIPAVQIYFITTLDAVICACMVASLCCFLHRSMAVRVVGAGLCVAVSMALTFATLFLFCVLPLFDAIVRRSVRASIGCLGVAALLYVALAITTGFNWLNSLLVAVRLENPHGFGLLSDPGSYAFTRVECVAELALFAGPTLLILWWRSLMGPGSTSEFRLLSMIALGVLLAMLGAGAFKTGETARSCLFVYPFVVLPLASRGDVPASLIFVLLGQSLVMQVVGDYYW